MYNITKGLPTKYQREVRRNLFQAVSDAEDKAEDEVEQNYQMNKQHFKLKNQQVMANQ